MKKVTLREQLNYQPEELKFGTSGRRGLVVQLTQLEIYINALAELDYLQQLPRAQGGIAVGDEFYFASDLRPSSTQLAAEEDGRGEIAQAVEQALRDAGMQPVYLGKIPTPALTHHGLSHGKGSIMITGSHIPFDRNGYKTNTAVGELLKKDEAPIQERVTLVRQRIYSELFDRSLFAANGMFKDGSRPLGAENPAGRNGYVKRYLNFFGSLKGLRLLVYQHSAVGRDLVVEILTQLGAEVFPAGRSETFVPIDTENVDRELLEQVQELVAETEKRVGPIDAVVSTDGDSDRPLLLGVDRPSGRIRFFGGDLVGMIVAEQLQPDAVVVPISCNDAVDRGALKDLVEPKTMIGSPHVIAGMEIAVGRGKKRVCGWEANGGFLTGSDWERDGKFLAKLPTRDALLPILTVLNASAQQRIALGELFERLPARFSKAALLKRVPRSTSLEMIKRFNPPTSEIRDIIFEGNGNIRFLDARGEPCKGATDLPSAKAIRDALSRVFSSSLGFGVVQRINYTDGLRLYFSNGDVAHARPSGNADELRIYAVADRSERAEQIAELGVQEPDGLLRRLLGV